MFIPSQQTNQSNRNEWNSYFSMRVYQTVLCTQGIAQLNSYQYEIISTDIALI